MSSKSDMENEHCAKKPKLEQPTIIKEGQAEILVEDTKVFYNPVQEFNRDLSVAVLTVFAETHGSTLKNNKNASEERNKEGIRVLEALSATGLRSIRYAKEVPGIKEIVANDISAKAVESIKKNIIHNAVENLVTPSHEDATMVMYQSRKSSRGKQFDAVDLDPYGCPTMFLDGAVQSVTDGGLLMITATDLAVLAGNSPETCYTKYGSVSLKSRACHEIALRILLQNVASQAARYGKYIVPLLSISADFYIRVFVKIFTSQIKCKENATKIGLLYQCTGCESMTVQPLCTAKTKSSFKVTTGPSVDQFCKHCKHRHHIGGPLWIAPIHDQTFVSELLCRLNNLNLNTIKRIEGVLNVVHEELDVPLYYALDRIMSIVRCLTPPMIMFRSALLNAGYQVSYSHANKISIKTNAPNDVIWDIVRAWEKKNPIKRDKLQENNPGLNILNSQSTKDISFDVHPHANPASREKHLSRFQRNPTVNWGPGMRGTMITDMETKFADSKKEKNQNKKSKKEKLHEIKVDEEKKIENNSLDS